MIVFSPHSDQLDVYIHDLANHQAVLIKQGLYDNIYSQMAQDWALASLIVALSAIALTISPASLEFISSIVRPLVSAIRPSLGKCETFEWAQIPDGPLHTCTYPPHTCKHIGVHDASQSWENALTEFFAIKRSNFVRKPKQLSLGTTYIRTDVKTLKSFMSLLNTSEALNPWDVGEVPLRIVFKPVEGLMTAYAQIRRDLPTILSDEYRLDVTKHEMELIFRGYPPWYQNPLSIEGGRHVQHPIVDESDLSRGGWIVAVGLSPTRPVTRHFLERQNRSLVIVERAIERVICCLKNLETAFPGVGMVPSAHTVVRQVHARIGGGFGYSGSHLHRLFVVAGFERLVTRRHPPKFIKGLTDEQIITTMKVFNYDEPLTTDEITQLRPVLESVVQACLLGVFKVVNHLYVIGARKDRPCPLPPELDNDGLVYIRERWESLED